MTFPRLLLAVAFLACAGTAAHAQEDGSESDGAPVVQDEVKPKPKPKKKAKVYDYDRSKYKSRELTEGETKTYRFNDKGEAVVPKGKKKPAAGKDKKRSEPPDEKPIERGCSAEMPCKMPDEADAL